MNSKKLNLILILITFLAFFLRVHGINYYSYGDEAIQVYDSLRLGLLKMFPENFHRVALCGFYGLFFIAGWVIGVFQSTRDFIGLYFGHQHIFYVAGRFFEAIAGTLCIPAIFYAGKKLYDKESGLIAALFLTVCFTYIEISQKSRGQALAAFMLLLALNGGIMIWRSGSARYYLLAGLAAGAAISCVFYSVTIAVPLLLFHLLRARDEAQSAVPGGRRLAVFARHFLSPRLAGGIAGAFAVFALASPAKVIALGDYLRIVVVNTGILGSSPLYFFGCEVGNAWKYYLRIGLPQALGINLLAVAVLGVLYTVTRPHRKESWVLIISAAVFFAVMGKGRISSPRYVSPMIPWLLLPGAYALGNISRSLVKSRRWRNALLAGVVLAIALPPGIRVFKYDEMAISKSTKNLAEEWILQNLPPGSRIAVENMGYAGPDLKFTPVIDHWIYNLSDAELKDLYRQRRQEGFDSFALKYFIDYPPERKYYIRTISIKDEITPEDIINEGYQYVVINSLSWNAFRSPSNRARYPDFTAKRLVFYQWLEKEGELVQSFRPDEKAGGEEISIYRVRR